LLKKKRVLAAGEAQDFSIFHLSSLPPFQSKKKETKESEGSLKTIFLSLLSKSFF